MQCILFTEIIPCYQCLNTGLLDIERHGFCRRRWAGAGRVLVHLLHVVRAALAGLLLQQLLERQPRPHARAVLEEQLGQRLGRVSTASWQYKQCAWQRQRCTKRRNARKKTLRRTLLSVSALARRWLAGPS